MLADVTIIIKTFERPDCLERLLASIQKTDYNCPVIIVDDSREPYQERIEQQYGELVSEYVTLPFNVGISKGRNEALKRVKTKYFLLNDDDFVYDERADVPWMREQLERTDLELIGGVYYEPKWHVVYNDNVPLKAKLNVLFKMVMSGKWEAVEPYQHYFERDGDTLVLHEIDYVAPFTRCDLVHNFFLAETLTICEKIGGWDRQLKNAGEHIDFFYRAMQSGVRVGATREVGVRHLPVRKKSYNSYRFGKQHKQDMKRRLTKNGFEQLKFENERIV